MSNFEHIGIKLTIPGDKDKGLKPKGKHPGVPDNITKHNMRSWIEKAHIDEDTKQELLKLIESYPGNTMHHFFVNLQKHIVRIQKKRNEKVE